MREALLLRCTICQETMKVGEKIVEVPECLHAFHTNCLFQWFSTQLSCPNCKRDIYAVIKEHTEAAAAAATAATAAATAATGGETLTTTADRRGTATAAAATPAAPAAAAAAARGTPAAAAPVTPAAAAAATAAAAETARPLFYADDDTSVDTADGWVDVELGPRTVGYQR